MKGSPCCPWLPIERTTKRASETELKPISDLGDNGRLIIDMSYVLVVRDKDGKVVEVKTGKAHSFLQNFMQILYGMFYAGTGSSPNASGNVVDLSGNSMEYPIMASAPGNTYLPLGFTITPSSSSAYIGIVVGSGSTTNSPSTYNLASPITNGSGSDQLTYGSQSINAVQCSNSTPYSCSFQVTRSFTNNGSSAVTVSEIGLVAETAVTSSSSGNTIDSVLIARDLVGSVTVNPGGSLTVTYVISLSIS